MLPGPGADAGLAAADGRFTVVQEVRGAPDGDVRVILRGRPGTSGCSAGRPRPRRRGRADRTGGRRRPT